MKTIGCPDKYDPAELDKGLFIINADEAQVLEFWQGEEVNLRDGSDENAELITGKLNNYKPGYYSVTGTKGIDNEPGQWVFNIVEITRLLISDGRKHIIIWS